MSSCHIKLSIYRPTKTSIYGFGRSRKCAVTVSSVMAVTETTAETDASLTAVTVAETDVTTNEACEIVFFISHASFYFYCHCRCALDSNFLKNSK